MPCPAKPARAVEKDLPGRPAQPLPGCSHRAVYYAARQSLWRRGLLLHGHRLLHPGYAAAPAHGGFSGLYGLVCFGGSGFARASGKPVVAFIGDSTFFHSGMTGLANAVFNRHDLILVVLDNGTTAMTGHQPNPGMVQDMLGSMSQHLDIETIVRALGVTSAPRCALSTSGPSSAPWKK